MSRRVPIPDPPPTGQHRPEAVVARRLAHMEARMADFDSLLSRLAAAEQAARAVGQTALDNAVAQLEPLVVAIEAALGVAPPEPPTDQPV